MRTVFIIGAGTNVDVGMPSGDQLKKEFLVQVVFSRSSRP